MSDTIDLPPQPVRPLRERLGQTVGLLLFGLLVLRQFSLFSLEDGFADLVRWALVTGFFVFACSAYATRRPARVLARNPLDVILPLVCAALPLVQSEVPSSWVHSVAEWLAPLGVTARDLWLPATRELVGWGLAIAAAGELITLIGLAHLRRSFSIFTEARELVTGGLYRFVRHPLYLGETMTVWGLYLAWPSGWALTVAILFTSLQGWRAYREERLLGEVFPEYAEYRRRTGPVWPRFRASGRGASPSQLP